MYCRICNNTFRTQIHGLSQPVDVYCDWIDECEKVNQPAWLRIYKIIIYIIILYYINEYLNIYINEYLNIYINEYLNIYINIYLIKLVSKYINI